MAIELSDPEQGECNPSDVDDLLSWLNDVAAECDLEFHAGTREDTSPDDSPHAVDYARQVLARVASDTREDLMDAVGTTMPARSVLTARALVDSTLKEIEISAGASDESLSSLLLFSSILAAGMRPRSRMISSTLGRLLARRIDEALWDERRRIAREIHDRVGSDLAYALTCLELYRVHSRSSPHMAASRVTAAHETVKRAWDGIREITAEPSTIGPVGGLKDALRLYTDQAAALGIALNVVVNGDETLPVPIVRDQITLILREAVRNALSHAEPQRVMIRVDIATDVLRAVVIDDGRGFDPADVSHGMGIVCMRERAELIGGTIRLLSNIGIGTRVELTVLLCPRMR
jgi:signal transduction histidine kinase